MNSPIRKKRLITCIIFTLFALFVLPVNLFAASKKTTISAATLQNGKQFTFINMPYNGKSSPIKTYQDETLKLHGIQNFAFTPDGKYVFTIAQADVGSIKHSLLCRCGLPSVRGVDATAPFQQAHVLDNYGHGEAIAITQPKLAQEAYYIWVACTSNGQYGTEIARLTYKVVGGEGQIVKTVIIKGFKKADIKNGKASTFKGSPNPTRLNVQVDKKTNQIMFRIKFASGCNYVVYDLKKLTQELNKVANGGSYSISKAVKYQKANIRTNLLPYGAFQSFSLDGKNLYICGGGTGKGAQIYVIPYKTYKNGKAQKQSISTGYKVINITPQLTINGKTLGKSELEIEGLQIDRADNGKINFYVTFYAKKMAIRNTTAVYKFTV